MYPKEYLYTEEHEWVLVDEDICTIGITDFAQKELGEIVYVELPEAGQSVDSGDELGSLESVKAVAEYYAPMAGEVVEVNSAVEDSPELVNDDPHSEGWLVKIRATSTDELKELMNAESYSEFIQSEDAE